MENSKLEKAAPTESTETDVALAKVRRMISRAHLMEPYLIMEGLETLAEAAANEKHKDAALYRRAFRTCKKYEDSKELGGLLVKLFGSQEDKKIQGAVAEWLKGLKTEGKSVKGTKQDSGAKTLVQAEQTPNAVPPFPFMPYMYGMQPSPQMYPQFPRGRGGPRGGRGRGQNQRACFYCKETDHLVADCPKMKKDQG